ncbi:MAG: hypothetical protein ACYDBB_24035 [Armatimonadota bacterium]
MNNFFQRLQSIDRRWVYLLLAATLVSTLLMNKTVDPIVLPSVQQLYTAVDQAKAGDDDGKIILVGMTFSAGTIGENGNQARALIRHLMLTHKRFAVMSISEPQGATYAQRITEDIAKQYGYEYGKDWINFGYQIGTLAFFKAFPRDIPGTLHGVDATQGKPLDSFPIMHGIKTINDVALHVEITASSSMLDWLQIVQPTTKPRLKIGYACTGVMATEAYPFLDSHQLIGMMPGLKGAADYEKLVDELEDREMKAGRVKEAFNPELMKSVPAFHYPARKLMFAQGAAHLLLIVLIILGNVGLLLSRRRARPSVKEVD